MFSFITQLFRHNTPPTPGPLGMVQPIRTVSTEIWMSGRFEKKIIDKKGKHFIIKIDVKGGCGTVARCKDKNFKVIDGEEIDAKELNNFDELFEEAEYEYRIVNMNIM